MKNDSLLSILQIWAIRRGLPHELSALNAPPPFLALRGAGPGILLTLRPVKDVQLGFWVESSGKGSWCGFRDGDPEIFTNPLPRFDSEPALLANIEPITNDFLRDVIFLPVLENTFPSAKEVKLREFSGAAAGYSGDWDSWRFFECHSREGYDLTVGLSGGEAALLTADDDGFFNFDERLRDLKDADAFELWLQQL